MLLDIMQASQDDLNDPSLDEGGPNLDDYEAVPDEQPGQQQQGYELDDDVQGDLPPEEDEEGEDLLDDNYLRYPLTQPACCARQGGAPAATWG